MFEVFVPFLVDTGFRVPAGALYGRSERVERRRVGLAVQRIESLQRDMDRAIRRGTGRGEDSNDAKRMILVE